VNPAPTEVKTYHLNCHPGSAVDWGRQSPLPYTLDLSHEGPVLRVGLGVAVSAARRLFCSASEHDHP